jgi:hypothetical protein
MCRAPTSWRLDPTRRRERLAARSHQARARTAMTTSIARNPTATPCWCLGLSRNRRLPTVRLSTPIWWRRARFSTARPSATNRSKQTSSEPSATEHSLDGQRTPRLRGRGLLSRRARPWRRAAPGGAGPLGARRPGRRSSRGICIHADNRRAGSRVAGVNISHLLPTGRPDSGRAATLRPATCAHRRPGLIGSGPGQRSGIPTS